MQEWQINYIGNRKYFYLVGLAVFILGPLMVVSKGFVWGLDFTGGSEYRYRFHANLTQAQILEAVNHSELAKTAKEFDVQSVFLQGTDPANAGKSEFIIRTAYDASKDKEFLPKLTELLNKIPDAKPEHLATQIIGPVVGAKLVGDTQLAVFLSVIFILLYMSVRFEMRHGVASTIALVHDTLAVLGAVALCGIPMDINIVAAILTVLGYSINDSIIILDRVRENLRLFKKKPFDELVNYSLNQTFVRTICTSGATIMSLTALLFLGPEVLRNFCFALIVGFVAGVLSSITVVCPLIVDWHFLDNPEKKGAEEPAK